MPLYLKGYRLDNDKIATSLNCADPTGCKPAIIKCIERESYRYIANGFELNGDLNLIIVMAGGDDAVALTRMPMPESTDKMLLAIARDVCTAGVWPCYDDVDNPTTFWANWLEHGTCRLGEMKEDPKGDICTFNSFKVNIQESTNK
ncbi:hypothetical protein BJ912DRAFT_989075 [Pholiota molesta]|nr:hypothetical protein BJ912DRAFT_989075 [Pholiota molesta]